MPGPLVHTSATSLADTPAPDAEAALVAGLRARDPAAVGQAYDLHHRAVRGFARRLVGDDPSAEDLVQDVFVALPGAIRGFDGRSALRTFLIGVAINHARHHLRTAARRRAAMARLAADLPSVRPIQPDQAADQHRLAAALARALDRLPLRQRLAFLLCDLEHRTSGEAAAILGIPEGTVRTRLHHGRERLRAYLRQEGVE